MRFVLINDTRGTNTQILVLISTFIRSLSDVWHSWCYEFLIKIIIVAVWDVCTDTL